MSIRANNLSDIQECLVQMLDACTSPWSDWTIINGWPDETIYPEQDKAYVYVMEPIKSGDVSSQGALTRNMWDVIIGFWVSRREGGPSEMMAFQTAMFNLFQNPQTVHTSQFTIVIGVTTYTNTNLMTQGITINEISGPVNLSSDTEFRAEFTITLTA